jgi:hypothetical protein
MVRRFDQHQERSELIHRLSKGLSKHAGFKCEWCEGKDDLRPYDCEPKKKVPSEETLLFLCKECRNILSAAPKKIDSKLLRNRLNGLWSDREVVKEGLAELLVQTGERWAIEAVENAWFEGDFKERLLPDSQ